MKPLFQPLLVAASLMALSTVSSAEEITAPDVPLNVAGVFPMELSPKLAVREATHSRATLPLTSSDGDG
ncbi:MAG: hypothetical protein OSA84_03380 [Akkermansiaceae bacterium]|nr:hypothetical protein [Akkermansiaceae bacterium]